MARRVLAALCLLISQPVWPGADEACAPLEGNTVRWIVPSVPGGGYDAYSRLIQPFLADALQTRVFIENRPEAGGIVAAMNLRDAPADGTTLGFVNASGLLAAGLDSDRALPDPGVDFSILARVVRNRMVLLAGSGSGISDFEQLAAVADTRPLVVGVRDTGSASFFAIPLSMDLLSFDYEVVTGYVGSTARVLAALRGEVDVIIQNFDSVARYIRNGELIPLLSIAGPISFTHDNGLRREIPALGGRDGLAVRRSAVSGLGPETAQQRAANLSHVIDAGRLVVAPAGLPVEIQACLESALSTIMTSPGLQQAALRESLELDFAPAGEARRDLDRARSRLPELSPSLRSAFETERG
jgi:tripartite-type tricarboxylate transporter receptor subunit TctC